MTSTILLTTEDFNENVQMKLGIDNDLSEDNADNYQINLTFDNNNSLTATVEDINVTENQTSPIVFTSLDPDELLSQNQKDYLQVVIDLDHGNLTGESQQQIVLTVFDSEQLGDRQLTDPLTGAVINSTDSELIVAIDTSNSNINEESSLLLETGGFTLDFDPNISSVTVSDLLESEDSLLSFGSISYQSSDLSVEAVSDIESGMLTINDGGNDNFSLTIF